MLKTKELYKKVSNGVLVLLLAFSFTGCYQELPNTKPSIDAEKMQAILEDIHKAEGLMANENSKAKKDSLALLYYQYILQIHQIDGKMLDSAMNSYYSNPIQLDSIYRRMQRALTTDVQQYSK